ncbi:TolC family protein [Halobacteriovorax sp. DPLXC-1]|uniref:TolC family protein n=1 Tax=Halobacteriovorax sp. DPLXC-1 TaxID=3110771 RepID=UPI002FEEC4DA
MLNFRLLLCLLFSINCFAIEDIYKKLVELSIKTSPDVIQKRENFIAAQERDSTSGSSFYPKVDLKLAQEHYNERNITPYSIYDEDGKNDLSSYEFTLSMPLFKKSLFSRKSETKSLELLSKEEYELYVLNYNWIVKDALSRYLIETYFTYRLDDFIEQSRDLIKKERTSLRLGNSIRADLDQTEVNLLNLLNQKDEVDHRQLMAKQYLMLLTGLKEDDTTFSQILSYVKTKDDFEKAIGYLSKFDVSVNDINDFLEKNTRKLKETSPFLKQVQHNYDAQVAKVKQDLDREYPELELRGSLYKEKGNWGDVFDESGNSKKIGVYLNIPLFSGFSTFSKKDAQDSDILAAEVLKRREERRFYFNIRENRLLIDNLEIKVKRLKEIVEKQRRILNTFYKSYKLGKVTMVDLIQKQNELLMLEKVYAESRIRLSTSLESLGNTIGVYVLEEGKKKKALN